MRGLALARSHEVETPCGDAVQGDAAGCPPAGDSRLELHVHAGDRPEGVACVVPVGAGVQTVAVVVVVDPVGVAGAAQVVEQAQIDIVGSLATSGNGDETWRTGGSDLAHDRISSNAGPTETRISLRAR